VMPISSTAGASPSSGLAPVVAMVSLNVWAGRRFAAPPSS
jgi:hypothetical protein